MICSKCYRDLDEDMFYNSKSLSRNKSYNCKSCESIRKRFAKYNLTMEQLESLLEIDECGICHVCLPKSKDRCIDHNHETGEVRGILCHHCNRAIGLLRDDEQLLLNAIKWINK